ncbi:hypothetical protein [Microbacterium sp. LWS13-1.2]|uniref:SLAIN motif-containing protein n=1 Tax=Microbacterium sp. LWS13-1.2 TaxID=3135264 RepID=A0AAU6S7N1_9MICO
MDWASINVPELLVGAVLGVAFSLPFFFHERRERKREVGVNWTKDLRRLEPLLGDSKTRYADLYAALSDVPVDHYRRVLGPDDFRLVEDLQNAYAGAEFAASAQAKAAMAHYDAQGLMPPDVNIHTYSFLSRMDPARYQNHPGVRGFADDIAELQTDAGYLKAEDDAIAANRKLNDLIVQVMNRGRERSRDEYADLMRREEWAKRRRDPIGWLVRSIKGWWRRRNLARAAQLKARTNATAVPPASPLNATEAESSNLRNS